MAIQWEHVTKWDPDPLLDTYDSLNRIEAVIEFNNDVLYDARTRFESHGKAAMAAIRVVKDIAKDIQLAEAQLTELMIDVRVAASGVEEICYMVRDAIAYASESLLTLSSTGEVEFSQAMWDAAADEAAQYKHPLTVVPADPPEVDLTSTQVYRRANECKTTLEEQISDVLEQAERVDYLLKIALEQIVEVNKYTLRRSTILANPEVKTEAILEEMEEARSPAEVRAIWDSLDPLKQAELLATSSTIIGAMNGIPFSVRAEANRRTAQGRLDYLNQLKDVAEQQLNDEDIPEILRVGLLGERSELQAEIDYLEGVLKKPGRDFILYDPDFNRIIEQNGAISQGVTEVYTHVPGTGTSYASFIEGSATALPSSLREAGLQQTTEISTFTYMDGNFEGDDAWINWTPFGDGGWNGDGAFFREKGGELAEFQAAVRLEAAPYDADVNIGGHSAGMGPIFHSENQGARYDQVDSLAGSSGFTSEWHPNASTDYNHYYYSPEMINAVQVLPGASPYGHEAFENHKFDGIDPLDNHGRVNTNATRNDEVINRLLEEMSISGK